MSIQTLTNYFLEYGAFFIFLIVLLEYLNLPGFPAGGDHAACRNLGISGGNQFSAGHGTDGGGRTDRKLGAVLAGKSRRR